MSPAWFAFKVHVPAVTIVTVVPETVQTLVVADVKTTLKFELEVAATVNAVSP